MSQLTILGLESSCDDTGAAVVRGTPGDVLPLLTGKRLKGELVLVLQGRRAAEREEA